MINLEKSKVLLIVEGERLEKDLFKHLYSLYNLKNVEIVAYKTNIYHFYNRLKKNYANIDGEIEYEYIDLPLFLNDYLNLDDKKKLNTYDFNDKILVFDFDPHDPQYSESKILELIQNFSNSTDLGKLYINYPMVESFKDVTSFDEREYMKHKIHKDLLRRVGRLSGYKRYVEKRSCIGEISDINKDITNKLFNLNAKKFMSIIKSDTYEEAEHHDILCKMQCKSLAASGEIAVLNTSILHLFDEYGEIK